MSNKDSLKIHFNNRLDSDGQQNLEVLLYEVGYNGEVYSAFFNDSIKSALTAIAVRKNWEISLSSMGYPQDVHVAGPEGAVSRGNISDQIKFYNYEDVFCHLARLDCKSYGFLIGDAQIREFLKDPAKMIPAEQREEIVAEVKARVRANAEVLPLSYKYARIPSRGREAE